MLQFRNWLRHLAGKLGFRISWPKRKEIKPKRPAVEQLEDRLAPATLVVNALADNITDTSHLTLRDAITLVNNAGNSNSLGQSSMPSGWASQIAGTFGSSDTIQFDSSLSGGTITLGGTELPQIANNVTITGMGATSWRSAATARAACLTLPAGPPSASRG